jgi:integrase
MSIKLQRRGQSWRLRYDLEPDASGSRQRRSATFSGTRKEAGAQAAKLLADIANGVDIDPSKRTVAEHLRAWLQGSHGLSAKTVERYAQLAEQQIIPHLGRLSLQKLRPAHVEDWHAVLLRSGGQDGRLLSARTVGTPIGCCIAGLSLRSNANGSRATSRVSSPHPRLRMLK